MTIFCLVQSIKLDKDTQAQLRSVALIIKVSSVGPIVAFSIGLALVILSGSLMVYKFFRKKVNIMFLFFFVFVGYFPLIVLRRLISSLMSKYIFILKTIFSMFRLIWVDIIPQSIFILVFLNRKPKFLPHWVGVSTVHLISLFIFQFI